MPNWTKEQSDAINKDGTNIIVSAGAGSGKTAVLSERVLRKLKEGVNVNELLILTFTKAAAKEMKERIRKKIKKEPSLSSQLELIDSAYITTFDSYSLSVLKKYHYLLNLPKNIGITDSTLVQIKKEEILDNIFEELYEEKNEKFEEFISTFCIKDDKEIRNYLLNIYSKLELKTDKKEYLEKVIYPLKNINSDISLEYLKNNYFTLHKDVAWSDKNFVNESGKFEIINCEEIKKFEANKYKDISKLRLLTNHGRDSLSSQHFMDDDGIAIAYINEKEAKRFNINNNEIIYLKSENGQIKVKINIDKSIGDNIVMMFVGWWERHGNPNFLTNSGISDIGGQITYNETFVEIIKR